ITSRPRSEDDTLFQRQAACGLKAAAAAKQIAVTPPVRAAMGSMERSATLTASLTATQFAVAMPKEAVRSAKNAVPARSEPGMVRGKRKRTPVIAVREAPRAAFARLGVLPCR